MLDMQVFSDERLSAVEHDALRAFYDICARHQATLAATVGELHRLALEAGIDTEANYKESVFMQALWYIYLSGVKANYDSTNWMVVLFSLVVAKKSKGIAILLIPKLVEGWNAKYVTGSGQKKKTSSRVHIFEHEGGVKPHARGKHLLRERAAAAANGIAPGHGDGTGKVMKAPRGSGKARRASKSGNLLVKSLSGSVDYTKAVIIIRNPSQKSYRGAKSKVVVEEVEENEEFDGSRDGDRGGSSLDESDDTTDFSDASDSSFSNRHDYVDFDGNMLEKQHAAHRWLDSMAGNGGGAIDPLLLAFPQSLSSSNSFDMGILSRDVSCVLKNTNSIGQELLLGADITRLDRFSSSNWGEFALPFSPRGLEGSDIDNLFI